MKALVITLILALVGYSMAAHTLCELRRGSNRCVVSTSGTTCPACPEGRTPVACSSSGNGFAGVVQCASCKKREELNEEEKRQLFAGGGNGQVCVIETDSYCPDNGLPVLTQSTVPATIPVCSYNPAPVRPPAPSSSGIVVAPTNPGTVVQNGAGVAVGNVGNVVSPFKV